MIKAGRLTRMLRLDSRAAITAVCVAVVAALGVSVGFFVLRGTSQADLDTQERAALVARAVEDRVFGVFSLAVAALEDMAEAHSRGEAPDRARRRALATAQSVGLRGVFVLNAEGVVIASSLLTPPDGLSFAHEEYFRRHRDATADADAGAAAVATDWIDPPRAGRDPLDMAAGRNPSAEAHLILSRRLQDRQGRFAGVAAAVIDARALEASFNRLVSGFGGSASLLRADGVVLARWPDPPAPGLREQSVSVAPERVRAGDLFGVLTERDQAAGGDALVVFQRVRGPGALVRAALPTEAARAEAREAYGPAVAASLAAGAAVVALLIALRRQSQREERARFALRISDERLRQRVDELESARDELEQKSRQLAVFARSLEIARDQAQEGARTKADFLANMSHEIRTPMNGVLGMTALLRDTPLTAEQQRCVRAIDDSASALLALINDILDLSKLEADKLVLERVPFDLLALAAGAVDLVAPNARQRGLDLQWVIDRAAPRRLIGDGGRLRQVLLNLLSNAVKFTDQGSVSLEVQLDARDGDRISLRMVVVDTGVGIAQEDQARLFQRFEQVDRSESRRRRGTGLGLAIARRLVELMGGEIGVDSRQGAGSVFWLTLPFDVESEDEPPAPILAGRRVLALDPSPLHRRFLTELFGRWGLEAETVRGVREAVELLREADAAGEELSLVVFAAEDVGAATELARRLHAAGGAAKFIWSAPPGADCRRVPAPIDAAVTKPSRHDTVLEAVERAFGVDVAVAAPAADRDLDALRARPARRLSILLAEDNVINQRVAGGMLEKMGHRVVTANDGEEAELAADRELFDLILMDVDMPKQDGLETTRRLRARGGRFDALPIIALTAYAMKGDAEMCLGAGMNDYLSKPVQAQALRAAIDRWSGADAPPSPVSAASEPSPDDSAWLDRKALDQTAHGLDAAVFRDLVGQFADETRRMLAELAGYATDPEAADPDDFRRAAHSLKSMTATLGLQRLSAAAKAIEQACRAGDAVGAAAQVAALEAVAAPSLAALARIKIS